MWRRNDTYYYNDPTTKIRRRLSSTRCKRRRSKPRNDTRGRPSGTRLPATTNAKLQRLGATKVRVLQPPTLVKSGCLLLLALFASTTIGVTAHERCGTPDLTESEKAVAEAVLTDYYRQSGPARIADRQSVTTIDVIVHVLHDGNVGNVGQFVIQEQMAVLNSAFVGFDFLLRDIVRTDNANYYACSRDNEREWKEVLRNSNHGVNVMYVYICQLPGLLGYGYLPSMNVPLSLDGVVVAVNSLPGVSSTSIYNEGDTLVHEVGHWLGLYHTFQGGCNAPGDYVDDTPAVSYPNFNCPSNANSCSNSPPDLVNNFMDYTQDSCMDSFTPGQHERMQAIWHSHRSQSDLIPIPLDLDTLTGPVTGSTVGATIHFSLRPCGVDTGSSPGMLYSVTGRGRGITLSTCTGTSLDTIIVVYERTADGFCSSNDDSCGLQSTLSFQAQDQTEYLILVQGYGSAQGEFEMVVTEETQSPTRSPTSVPTMAPTRLPSGSPTVSVVPSSTPSSQPSLTPTATPSTMPSLAPTVLPSMLPTFIPSVMPSSKPSFTSMPSQPPTEIPSMPPSVIPSAMPSAKPSFSSIPSRQPTAMPSPAPVESFPREPPPTPQPTTAPTMPPTVQPTSPPTDEPTMAPTGRPTDEPTFAPSAMPIPIPTPTESDPWYFTIPILGSILRFLMGLFS